MNELSTQVNSDHISIAEAAQQFRMTSNGFSAWLKRNSDIKDEYCFKAKYKGRRKTVIKVEALPVIANLRNIGGNQKSDTVSPFREGKKKVVQKAMNNSKTEQILSQLLEQQASLIERIDKLERTNKFLALPKAEEEPPELDYRQKIVQRVNAYAQERDIPYKVVYGKLYYEFSCRHRMNLKQRADNRNLKPMEMLAELGMLKDAWIVACKILPLVTDN